MIYWLMDRRYIKIVDPESFAEIAEYESRIGFLKAKAARKGRAMWYPHENEGLRLPHYHIDGSWFQGSTTAIASAANPP